jgi:hypothetical protein
MTINPRKSFFMQILTILLLPVWSIYWIATLIDFITIKCNDWWSKIENYNEILK